ncbi:hypothetical protein ACUOFU_16720 [Microbacterium arabinogalactanolyticum]|uniref:hypothetical protein n=1 Tax=Microbacterium arabinogalactanolyticum TaxID=69365 RepID=UPI0040439B11
MAQDIGAQLMLAEWLFVETVADLRDRSHDPASRSRYELLGIALLLRKLLTDRGEPLLATVKRDRLDVPTQFRIRPWQVPADADDSLEYLVRLSGPDLVGDAETVALTADQFLAARVGLLEGRELSTRQVIRYYAHVEGGVHFGDPREDGQEAMSSMVPVLLGNTPGQIEILGYLGQIVVDALTPLRDSILTSPTIVPAMHRLNSSGSYDHHWTAEYYASSREKARE